MSARDESHPVERLSALLDGELAAEDRASLEAHLRACARCRALLEGLRAVSRAAAGEEPPPVPDGLAGRIAWRIRAAHRPRTAPARPWWRSPVPLTAAATVAAVGLLIGTWWLERGEPGVPDLPGVARRSVPTKPSRPVPTVSAPPVAKPATSAEGEGSAPPASLAGSERERKEAASRQAAPKAAGASAERRYAEVSEERYKKAESGEVEAIGGVVGGVLGGIVPSDQGPVEREAAAPAPRDERMRDQPSLAAQPVSVPPEATVARSPGEKDARCPSSWSAPPPEGWILRGVDPGTAGEEILRLAAGLRGRAQLVATQPVTWRLEVERGRFRELVAALRALGVSGAEPDIEVPADSACAEVRVRIVP